MWIRLDRTAFDLQGVCPVCRWWDLEYQWADIDWDTVSYKWTCNDCHSEWTEWYTMEFYSQDLRYDWPQKKSVDDEDREYTILNI